MIYEQKKVSLGEMAKVLGMSENELDARFNEIAIMEFAQEKTKANTICVHNLTKEYTLGFNK